MSAVEHSHVKQGSKYCLIKFEKSVYFSLAFGLGDPFWCHQSTIFSGPQKYVFVDILSTIT